MVGIVVGILIAIAIAQLGHQLCGSIAEMKRNGLVASLLHQLQGIADSHIGRIALGRGGQIDRTFS